MNIRPLKLTKLLSEENLRRLACDIRSRLDYFDSFSGDEERVNEMIRRFESGEDLDRIKKDFFTRSTHRKKIQKCIRRLESRHRLNLKYEKILKKTGISLPKTSLTATP